MIREEDSKKYQKLKKRFFFIGIALDLVVLTALWVSGGSIWLRDLSFKVCSNIFILNGAYISFFCFGLYIIHLPLNYYLGFVWEHKFNLSNQTFKNWTVDEFKKSFISFVVIFILIQVVYLLLRKFPEGWWIGASMFWLFLTLVLARITPQFLIPLFYKYSVVEDAELRERVMSLFKKCNVTIENVYAIDASSKTKKPNAFVCGLGKSRRVVLGDTLLSDFTVSEIEAVVAHELAHYKNRDIIKIIAVNTVMVFAGFYLIDVLFKQLGISNIADIAYFPVITLAFMVFGFLATPLSNWFSRWLEANADLFCLEMTKNPSAFATMMQKLGEMSLSDFAPNWFDEILFFDHPPIAKRILMAKEFEQSISKEEH